MSSAGCLNKQSAQLLERLDEAFGQTFAVVDCRRGVLERVTPDWPRIDPFRWLAVCKHVVHSGRPEIVEEHAPLSLLAVPLPATDPLGSPSRVALAVLLNGMVESIGDVDAAACLFGIDPGAALQWSQGREPIPTSTAFCLAEAIFEAEKNASAIRAVKGQLSETSARLIDTFEELNVLHRLTQRLSIDHDECELCENTTHWLAEVVAADVVVGRLYAKGGSPALSAAYTTHTDRDDSEPFTTYRGPMTVIDGDLDQFFDRLGDEARRHPMVLNRDRTASPTWGYPGVREVVTAPILGNGSLIGWLAVINRSRKASQEGGFGAVEASLLGSVAAILGVHAGNRRQLAEHIELFGGAVRALSSAIDAKDPYTCGHSDRVARIAVRIAEQMRLPREELNNLYLGGLLHDVGKIGIDDNVLRKPGELTEDEYEHIKTHSELGVRILSGVRQLESVLPLVGHHHEAWDGTGYPSGMAGEQIPLGARITAVADAIDAMGSDRPYRKGMPHDQVEAILREGSGTQWDPAVVDAYIAVADDVAEIEQIDRAPLDLDVSRWGDLQASISAT